MSSGCCVVVVHIMMRREAWYLPCLGEGERQRLVVVLGEQRRLTKVQLLLVGWGREAICQLCSDDGTACEAVLTTLEVDVAVKWKVSTTKAHWGIHNAPEEGPARAALVAHAGDDHVRADAAAREAMHLVVDEAPRRVDCKIPHIKVCSQQSAVSSQQSAVSTPTQRATSNERTLRAGLPVDHEDVAALDGTRVAEDGRHGRAVGERRAAEARDEAQLAYGRLGGRAVVTIMWRERADTSEARQNGEHRTQHALGRHVDRGRVVLRDILPK